jgi:hypothetical protein
LTWEIALSMTEVVSGPFSAACNCAQVTFSTNSLKLLPYGATSARLKMGMGSAVLL